jgi:indole-3-glycerol phosphate synthase
MILDELAAYAAKRVADAKKITPIEEIREAAMKPPKGCFRFERTLKGPGMSFICEVKKASPSKGIISEAFPYREIAKEYEDTGADCVSCLTEPKWFLGSDQIFREIRSDISLPMIRKDFTVDEYQLYEAKCMGADAVLLICSLLDTGTLAKYLKVCDEMGISALVETHDEAEIESAVSAGARLIGVNNRNLKDFTVDFLRAAKLRDKIPPSALFVAESGINSPSDVASLKAIGTDAILIGEALMRAKNKREMLLSFRRAAQ